MRRCEHRIAQLRARARAQAIAAIRLDQPASAIGAEEDLLEHGLAHQPEQRHVVTREPDERPPQRRADEERAGAVDRIDVPPVRRAAAPLGLLLADDAVIGIALGYRGARHALDRLVGIRDGVERVSAFVLDREGLTKVRLRDAAGGMGELDREVFELEDWDIGMRHVLIMADRSGKGARSLLAAALAFGAGLDK